MNPIINPYTPGAGTRPPALTGRDEELSRFETLVDRLLTGRTEKNLLVTGLRGVGKTVLLNTFANVGESKGFHSSQTEVSEGEQFAPIVARMTRRALLGVSPVERMRSRVKRALAILKAFSVTIPGGPEIGFDLEVLTGTADSGNLADDLSDLFVAVGEAARDEGKGILFFFDEIHYLRKEDLAALIAATHQVAQRNLPLAVIGAGLPQLPGLAGSAKSYAERLFDFPMIGRLPDEAASMALVQPASDLGVEYDPDAVERIVRLAEGYPYFLQEYGKHVWNISPRTPITVSDVEDAVPRVRAALDESFFRVRIWKVTPSERRYMRAMAELGPGVHLSKQIADKLGREITSVAPTRSSLIGKGLIYGPQHGQTAFTVPQFDQFLRRMYPDWRQV